MVARRREQLGKRSILSPPPLHLDPMILNPSPRALQLELMIFTFSPRTRDSNPLIHDSDHHLELMI